jgi:predicted O-methyltransferase YrrM
VDGLISGYLGFVLDRTVRERAGELRRPVVEVGAFKGLSTVFLSNACAKVGTRLHSFELFQGLPAVNEALDDPKFKQGQFRSTQDEYESNVRTFGRRDVVDLHVGDACAMLPSVLADGGFSVCFLDVDLYEATSALLKALWGLARGGETILVHDVISKGVRHAIDEFHVLSGHVVRESAPEVMTAMLQFPAELGQRR